MKNFVMDRRTDRDKQSMSFFLSQTIISEAASRALNPAVRFVLPDLELGTVWEENGNGNGNEDEEDESGGKGGEGGKEGEGSFNNTNHRPKRRHLVKVKVFRF